MDFFTINSAVNQDSSENPFSNLISDKFDQVDFTLPVELAVQQKQWNHLAWKINNKFRSNHRNKDI